VLNQLVCIGAAESTLEKARVKRTDVGGYDAVVCNARAQEQSFTAKLRGC